MDVLRTRDDFELLGRAYFARAGRAGVEHAEVFFDPQAHVSRGVDLDEVVHGLSAALDWASSTLGISGGLILCFLRDRPVGEAHGILDLVGGRFDRIVGVGLDSAERGYPPSLFATVFERARRAGLHRVAHAGEEGPPSYIAEALDLLGAERIDHGVRVLEDPRLVRRLADASIPLTVCPVSNVRLGVSAGLAAHPVRRMVAAGLVVTLNSDDPAYFGSYLDDVYDEVGAAHGLDDGELAALARASITSSFASGRRKAELLRRVQAWEDHREDDSGVPAAS